MCKPTKIKTATNDHYAAGSINLVEMNMGFH